MMSKDKDPSILFEVKCGLLCLLCFKYFSQYAGSVENWGLSVGYFPVLTEAY